MSGKSVKFLLFRLVLILAGIANHLAAQAQTADEASRTPKELFTGYSFFSNSFNGHQSDPSHQPLNGWEVSFAKPFTSRLSYKIEADGYYGTSFQAPQRPIFLLGGAAYTKRLGKEAGFVEGLAGLGLLNSDWWGGEVPGATKSFAGSAGGGVDTPLTKRLAFRVEGVFVYANFTINDNQIHGLPNYFARISSGLVWRF